MSETRKLLLVDGSYFAYRSFYAIREIYGGGDMSKNALFGFCRDLKRMTDRTRAEMVGVVWDGGIPQGRSQLLPDYKQQRPPMPVELKAQIPAIEAACKKMGIGNLRVHGQEADDLIASYSKRARECSLEVIIATNDKDIFQVVKEGVSIYTTVKKYTGEGGGHALLGEGEVSKIWGVSRAALIKDILALTGDSSDNIPGVPGIGPKTACKLINASGGVDKLLESPVVYTNPRIAKLLEDHRSTVERNMKLVALDENIDLPAEIESLNYKPQPSEVGEYLRSFGFLSLAKDWEGGGKKSRTATGQGLLF
jgi:5'-3' exonuclease